MVVFWDGRLESLVNVRTVLQSQYVEVTISMIGTLKLKETTSMIVAQVGEYIWRDKHGDLRSGLKEELPEDLALLVNNIQGMKGGAE